MVSQLAHCDPASARPVRKVFFGTVDEALSELAGYRGPVGSGWGPCPRCRPAGTAFSGVTGAAGREQHGAGILLVRPMTCSGKSRWSAYCRSPAKPGGVRRFRYEASGQECPDWFKIPQDLDPASAKWQMFLLGPGATIHA
jgi:hypothetical protein